MKSHTVLTLPFARWVTTGRGAGRGQISSTVLTTAELYK